MRIYYLRDSLYGKTVPIEADSKEHAQEQYIDFCDALGMPTGELTFGNVVASSNDIVERVKLWLSRAPTSF